jgi:hypothetical protein
MNKVIVDAELRSRLHDLSRPFDLCDESGRILGRFIPTGEMSQWEPMTPEVSEEELDRREREGQYMSTNEMLRHLENTGCS